MDDKIKDPYEDELQILSSSQKVLIRYVKSIASNIANKNKDYLDHENVKFWLEIIELKNRVEKEMARLVFERSNSASWWEKEKKKHLDIDKPV